MRDHTPNFTMHELSAENRSLISTTLQQLLEKLAADGKMTADSLLEFWVEVPGVKRIRGTFRGGFLMPDSFVYLSDYFLPDASNLTPTTAYGEAEKSSPAGME